MQPGGYETEEWKKEHAEEDKKARLRAGKYPRRMRKCVGCALDGLNNISGGGYGTWCKGVESRWNFIFRITPRCYSKDEDAASRELKK